MSELDLDELERLEAAATPGPVELAGDGHLHSRFQLVEVGSGTWRLLTDLTCGLDDAKLFAALRNAAPALIAAARERDSLRGAGWTPHAGCYSAASVTALMDERDSLRDRLSAAENERDLAYDALHAISVGGATEPEAFAATHLPLGFAGKRGGS